MLQPHLPFRCCKGPLGRLENFTDFVGVYVSFMNDCFEVSGSWFRALEFELGSGKKLLQKVLLRSRLITPKG